MTKLIRQLGQPASFHLVTGQKGAVGGHVQSAGMVRLYRNCLFQNSQRPGRVTGS